VLAAAGGLDTPVTVARLSGLYGPGRFGVIDRVRQGRLALGPGDERWTNWGHRDDAVGLIRSILTRGEASRIYHGSDEAPLRRRDLVVWIASRLGVDPVRLEAPPSTGRRGANRRISSERTRRELGLELVYPTIRAGLAEVLPFT
jgi:nucleoside-diphosphate-sugar epimerase